MREGQACSSAVLGARYLCKRPGTHINWWCSSGIIGPLLPAPRATDNGRVRFVSTNGNTIITITALMVLALSTASADAFIGRLYPSVRMPAKQRMMFPSHSVFLQFSNNNNHEAEDLPDQSDDGSLSKEVKKRAEKIMVEKERERLEKANFLKRLRSKPRKLPYADARKWVQANLGVDTKAEFFDLVANGNLRTPYIPKNPEKYYKDTRDWISWEHFLSGLFDDKTPSAIRPQTGIFD